GRCGQRGSEPAGHATIRRHLTTERTPINRLVRWWDVERCGEREGGWGHEARWGGARECDHQGGRGHPRGCGGSRGNGPPPSRCPVRPGGGRRPGGRGTGG